MKLQRDLFVIDYDPARADPAAMIETIDALGFKARQLTEAEGAAEPEVDEEPGETSAAVTKLLAQAKRDNLPLVLEFSGRFCGACERLEKETLADPRVQSALAKVIFRKIMVEDDRAAARQFGVHAIPQLRFIAPGGEVVAQDQGVVSVEVMIAHLARLTD